mmetsp:Transcript_68978/g.115144  ORF Transcript_68978/g.115144 Transcript_68978/m.115144 type:complete len:89 (-) Transcript_68978:813-1079(-)
MVQGMLFDGLQSCDALPKQLQCPVAIHVRIFPEYNPSVPVSAPQCSSMFHPHFSPPLTPLSRSQGTQATPYPYLASPSNTPSLQASSA